MSYNLDQQTKKTARVRRLFQGYTADYFFYRADQ